MHYQQPPQTYIGQVKLRVADLEESVAYYTKVIGLKIIEESQGKVSLGTGGKILLYLEEGQGLKRHPDRHAGLYHFALLLPSRADLADVVKFYVLNRVPFGASDHGVSEAIYLNDPDGNGIEVYADKPDTGWKWINGEIQMTTDPLDGDSLLKEASDTEWHGLPDGTIMGHIHLYMRHLGDAAAFYNDVLGFETVVSGYPGALFVSTGSYHHHIGLNTWHGANAPSVNPDEAGMEWFSIVFPDEQALLAAAARAEAVGLSVKQENNIYILKDPVGSNVRLVLHEQ
ncbi:catechol 2,3-dioxygenase [Terribacillus halophilus]|uniref:Catechol 2,3-dioxygenase n=1 Tax=Terribacillus halophilus TaxID=361279 RepID=A0A1G6KKG7_9BACI|nr:VOC family protein [Terribacillus halophilus]SDC31321.1 catechol 2,3-dioxygenase [Terribacillus halophilus]